MNSPAVSLVVPARNEAGNLAPLIDEVRQVLDAAGLTWELFVVDDGSTDGSWEEISAASAADARVQGIRQGRGLGKSAALEVGFARCRAASIVMLDGDGQDDPAEIPGMLARLAEPAQGRPGADLVNGWKVRRLDPWHKTFPSRVFNWLVGCLTGLWLHDHNCGLKAFRAPVVRQLSLGKDMHRFIPVQAAARGFRVVEVPVHHRPRTRGQSKYGMARFFTGLADLVRVAVLMRRAPPPGPSAQRFAAIPSAAGTDRLGDAAGKLRRSIYWLLAAVALGGTLGRIGAVTSIDKLALEKRLVSDAVAAATAKAAPLGETVDAGVIRTGVEQGKRLMRPFLSGNDRSRWLAIRALVERGTFAIDELVVEPGWDTIDAVAHTDATGHLRLYSSKPPLLSVLASGPYWLLHRLTGWTLGDHPFEMGRLLMVLYGLLPLGLTILCTCRLVEHVGTTDWGRVWGAALIACGTLLTTFAVVFTNHLPAAACTAGSLWLLFRICCQGAQPAWTFAAAGLLAGLAAALELPALAWTLAVLVLLATTDFRRTISLALPLALAVGLAALGTNFAAHGTLFPPYAHRSTAAPGTATAARQSATLPGGQPGEWNPSNWYDYQLTLSNGKVLTSYWRNPQAVVDRGEPSAIRYAWHALVGHHGIFSLTPAWLLVIPGIALALFPRQRIHEEKSLPRGFGALVLAIGLVSLVVVGFYLARPEIDRNYGGTTSGFRWAFWLAPLWTVAALPAADRLATSPAGRGLGWLLLALSVVSVAYPTWNPWTQPWIEQWMIHAGSLPAR